MDTPTCQILDIFIGGPKTLVDGRGEWQSSIARDRVEGPAQLETRGFVGDKATQSYHGTPEIAVCIHFQNHYYFWNRLLGMNLQPGAVGENITLDAWDESSVCVGDILRMGTARVQISAPRTPCENQARYIGRPDWVKRTIQELRTGVYARVLEPGVMSAGTQVVLESRPNPGLTVRDLTRCYYHRYDTALAERLMAADGLMEWWKQRLRDQASEGGERF